MTSTRNIFAAALAFATFSVTAQEVPKDWMHKSPEDAVYGMDTERAHQFLKGKTSTTLVVGVIDSGVEIDHPDLKPNIWVNANEVPGNKIDDDKNGYIDDVNGWDFIGGANGEDVHHDTYELARLYKHYGTKFNGVTAATVPGADKALYADYVRIKQAFETEKADADKQYAFYLQIQESIDKVLKDIGKEDITAEDLTDYNPTDPALMTGKMMLSAVLAQGVAMKDVMAELKEGFKYFESRAQYGLNPNYDPRPIVGDNYLDSNERVYGNAEVEGPDALHGTHVAGIIGAVRGNGEGIDGVADNVRIIAIRCVPDGDERDKDVANSIRYAVDNGAKVVNMSFGKSYVFDKKAVDDAVKYAMAKDVLLVHGAGNDAKNVDKNTVYPNDQLADGTKVTNWLNVGANDIAGNTAAFSNYGKKNVDVFAPGVDIYSTLTDYGYKYLDGTSMASPAAAGVAALIRSYYPDLTAEQVKKIMIKSVYKPKHKVNLPGSEEEKKVKLKKISKSGGIVNAYKAVQLADKKSKS
ncbi:MAG TPA: S8 family serine peptidase [Chitinophagales bacterium]|nr:S8 family serine peptidase [Chitinophagales bacterium]